ncbi:hypothetical protein Pmani_034347 [Petrolisthes manimaculis]|uniref:Uncharacterized protein n=1 Tax=Petrolisthes manimaculis TaxID=1843537 RepID=A0AAE1NNX9_9EUCA|nr:hypothetical protein Pmani_034347 [Petrolisthes manimaculis]
MEDLSVGSGWAEGRRRSGGEAGVILVISGRAPPLCLSPPPRLVVIPLINSVSWYRDVIYACHGLVGLRPRLG